MATRRLRRPKKKGRAARRAPRPISLKELKARLEDAEDTLRAIRSGEVDALVVNGLHGDQVFTLQGADYPYRVLVEFMNEGAATLSIDGTILYCNARLAHLLNHPLDKIMGHSLAPFIAPADRGKLNYILGNASAGGSREELHLRATDGIQVPVQVSARRVETEGMYTVSLIVTDLTDVIAAQEARLQLAALVESSQDAIVAQALDGKVTGWNQAAARLYGYSAKEILGRSFALLLPSERRSSDHKKLLAQTMNGMQIDQHEAVHVHRDGTSVDVDVTFSPIRDRTGSIAGLSMIARGIAERKQAAHRLQQSHAQLRDLTARLESVREEERSRLAREIHDELGQALTGLKLDLSWLKQRMPSADEAQSKKFDTMSASIDDIIDAVRAIATELRPVVLDQLGLLPAIEWLAGECQARTGLDFKVNFFLRQIPLSQDKSTAVFRIVQEVLTNIARHAEARSVTITGQESRGNFVIEVTDDGRGITEAEHADPKSLGLLSMRERAALFGGTTLIARLPEGGTRVTVTMPLGDVPQGGGGR